MRPQQLQARLESAFKDSTHQHRDFALLELAQTASSMILALIKQDGDHNVEDGLYRGFYSIISDILRDLESPQPGASAKSNQTARRRFFMREPTSELKRKLGAEFLKATRPRHSGPCAWEDIVSLVGRIVTTISDVPILAPLKPAGGALVQIGELVKTMRSNNEESVHLAKYAADILDTLSRNIQHGGVKVELSQDMRRDVEAFERTLFRVRDHLEKLQQEKRWKRVARFVFAKETKEQLASLRTELDRAQLVFMTSSIFAIRLEVHACAIQSRGSEQQQQHRHASFDVRTGLGMRIRGAMQWAEKSEITENRF
ncbi:hypothetical protein V5O48_010695 [Marasmius crinis-equi]|uniref:Uncharacterized protein n=1 Tax=Marasmius crinis-equi TaxID=585013 RepID=A0ABR3F7Y2_9AGAR